MVIGKAEYDGQTSGSESVRQPYDPLLFETMADPEAALAKYWGKTDGRAS